MNCCDGCACPVADRMRRERLAKTDAVPDDERKREALVLAINRGRLDVIA